MSADDQTFLDVLSSVPRNAKQFSDDVADYMERQFDFAAQITKKVLSSEWIPEPARRSPPSPPQCTPPPLPLTLAAKLQNWVYKHKILTVVILAALGGVTYKVVKHDTPRKRRRARRALNNARSEVVLIAGSPAEPITRSIAQDLERRGFVIYVVCGSIEEEALVQNESRQDIKPLMIDTVDPASAKASIERFAAHLQSAQFPFHGARPHHLNLRSLIVFPSLAYPSSPIATLAPSTVSDLLNTRLLHPILTIQNLLPLLTSPSAHTNLDHPSQPHQNPSILILTPSIISSLSPAFHAPESTIVNALTSFTSVLSAELSPLSIPVTQLQLGTFDFSSPLSRQPSPPTVESQRAETLKWERNARHVYGKNFVALSMGIGAARGSGSSTGLGRGTSLRELNDRVFDVMMEGKGGVSRVGMGSSVYTLVGAWFPRGLVAWMLGVRSVENENEFNGRESITRVSEPGSSNALGSSTRLSLGSTGLDSSVYIPVYGDVEGEDGWKETL